MDTFDAEPEACPMPLPTQAPPDEELALILARSRTVAVVGASPRPTRTSHAISVWLMENTRYEVFLVNPMAGEEDIEGHGFYADVRDLPVTPDIVVAFRRAEDIPPVADAAIACDAAVLWMQLGIENEQAAALARAAGLDVIQNRCIKVEYARLKNEIDALQVS
jgi:predicted CoA-binding protein